VHLHDGVAAACVVLDGVGVADAPRVRPAACTISQQVPVRSKDNTHTNRTHTHTAKSATFAMTVWATVTSRSGEREGG
jgi:hypothetical protein